MILLPQIVVALSLLGAAFGLAAVPFVRRPSSDRRSRLRLIVPRPDQPSSMLTVAALPTFLLLLSLARFGVFLAPAIDPVNSPGSGERLFGHPEDVDVTITELNDSFRYEYPKNTADLTANAAHRVGLGLPAERARAVRDLAWWTSVCPNYARFTVPRLARALRDPDDAVKGAAAIGLGSTGGHGSAAIPDLLAARGTSVRYFDYLVAEAVSLIKRSPKWPPEAACEDVPMEELERRAAQQVTAPAKPGAAGCDVVSR